MDLKTISIHFDKDTNVERLLAGVKPLANSAKSHLVGVFTMPPVPHGIDMGGPWREQLTTDYQNEFTPINDRLKSAFEASCQGETFTYEWRFVSHATLTIQEGILPETHAADLIVASAGQNPGDAVDATRIPDVLLSSGRPVILIPGSGAFSLVDTTVTIAWKSTREAARAVFDALPILHRAKTIRLLTIDERSFGATSHNPLSAADIASALSRHGLSVDVMHRQDPGQGIGATILDELDSSGANFLVMGAYGHSRFREFVLGGATRHVLQNITIPVMMTN